MKGTRLNAVGFLSLYRLVVQYAVEHPQEFGVGFPEVLLRQVRHDRDEVGGEVLPAEPIAPRYFRRGVEAERIQEVPQRGKADWYQYQPDCPSLKSTCLPSERIQEAETE